LLPAYLTICYSGAGCPAPGPPLLHCFISGYRLGYNHAVGIKNGTLCQRRLRTFVSEQCCQFLSLRIIFTAEVHCCGNTDWPLVLSTSIDLLSFDAYNYAHTVSLLPREVTAFLDRGGSIAWGLIPNMEDQIAKETVGTLLKRFESYMDNLYRKGMDLDLLLERSMITPQCGLGGLDETNAERVLELLNGTVDAIRQRYRLGDMS